MSRLRDKFKKYRSRSKGLTGTPQVDKMKEKYGRKRTSAESAASTSDVEVIKVQRLLVSCVNIGVSVRLL